MEAITEPLLRSLIRAASVNQVRVITDDRYWYVVAGVAAGDNNVSSQRSAQEGMVS